MRRELIILVLGVVVGMVLSFLVGCSTHLILFMLILASIFGGGFISTRDKRYFICALALVFVILGFSRACIVPSVLSEQAESQVGVRVEVRAVVDDVPDVRESHQRVVLKEEDGSRVLAVVPLYPELSYGERVTVSGVRTLPETFETESGRVFRYDKYLHARAIGSVLSYATVHEVRPREGVYHARGVLLDVRKTLEEGITLGIPEPEASLALGMLLGGKQGLGPDLIEVFTIVGLLHIVVLSGYNVMVVAESVLSMTQRFGKRIALSIAGIVLVLYVVMAGGGSAALRALLMALIALFARYTGKTYGALQALAVVVLLMLLTNPLLLLYDPGFGLSVMATLGLILGTPLFEKVLPNRMPRTLREVVSTTLGAQIFVLPLLLYETGNLSLVTLPVSVLILPVIPLAMGLSFISALSALLMPPLALLVSFPAYLVLLYITTVATVMSTIPLANITLGVFPFVVVLLAYACIFAWVYVKTRADKLSARV